MNVYCPKHPKEILRSIFYTLSDIKAKRKSKHISWFFCRQCNKLYKPKVTFK